MAKDKEHKGEMAKVAEQTATAHPDDFALEDLVVVTNDEKGAVGNLDPLLVIALSLANVAKGASVVELRKVVVQVAPPVADKEARIKYVTQLKRMRDAADTALVLAQELASGV